MDIRNIYECLDVQILNQFHMKSKDLSVLAILNPSQHNHMFLPARLF